MTQRRTTAAAWSAPALLAAASLAPGSPPDAGGAPGSCCEPGPMAACFDACSPPGPEVRALLERAMAGRSGGDRFVGVTTWPGPDNTPVTLTWSLAPDGLTVPTTLLEPPAPSELFADMDAAFADAGGREAWIGLIQSAFDRWGALTGVRFQRLSAPGQPWDDGEPWGAAGAPISAGGGSGAGVRGDIRIAMKPLDGPGGVLAVNAYPPSGDMLLDSSENWASPANGFRLLRNAVSHELGHALGLAHVCPANRTKLMEPFLLLNLDGPQQDDLRGVQRAYGDVYEPNNSLAAATPLGTLTPGGRLDPSTVPAPAIASGSLTSIALDGDVDVFSFMAGGPLRVTVAATPVGTFYADYTQDAPCSTLAPTTDALDQANIAVALFDASGSVMVVSAGAGFGQPEVINAFALPGPGRYYVKVYETNVPSEPQLYTLLITAAGQACTADFNRSGSVTVQDVFDFLVAYFSGDPAADVNGSGSVSVQDIFDFLATYFAGC